MSNGLKTMDDMHCQVNEVNLILDDSYPSFTSTTLLFQLWRVSEFKWGFMILCVIIQKMRNVSSMEWNGVLVALDGWIDV